MSFVPQNKIVIFGSGATGRGHIGLLAWQAGFEVVFVDINPKLVQLLRTEKKYRVRLFGENYQEVDVSGFRVYDAANREAIVNEIINSVLVLTAVFDQNLPDVAVTLAQAVTACRSAGRDTPINCIACENMMDSSSTLGRHVHGNLSGVDLAYCQEFFGFPDCMISRVVPRPEPDPLVIITEDYNEWTVRSEAYKGEKPQQLTAMELVQNQTARLERKLFIHNGGHAICGYYGFQRKATYIHEALQDPVVVGHVSGALDELGEIVREKHGFSKESIEAYKKDLGRRGAIAELKDQILRVVRDPIRKLSSHERLVAPALLAGEYGLSRYWIVQGILAALNYCHPEDSQSVILAKKIKEQGLPRTLSEICGIDPDSTLGQEIMSAKKDW